MSQPKQVVLVEYDLPAPAEREEWRRRVHQCLALRSARWVRSFVTPDGRRAICQFEAPDAESVREAYRASGQPVERAWVADMFWREE
jgi:hypothetical protein